MKSHPNAAESWLRPLLDTMSCNRSSKVEWQGGGSEGLGGVRDREGVRDGVVQGVWLRAGLVVVSDWGTGGCGTGGLGVWGGARG